jgi:hypothetical protein
VDRRRRGAGREPRVPRVKTVELGWIKLDAQDANILFPDLAVTRDSVFVRLGLEGTPARDTLGKLVRITLTSPARPRLWLWLSSS